MCSVDAFNFVKLLAAGDVREKFTLFARLCVKEHTEGNCYYMFNMMSTHVCRLLLLLPTEEV